MYVCVYVHWSACLCVSEFVCMFVCMYSYISQCYACACVRVYLNVCNCECECFQRMKIPISLIIIVKTIRYDYYQLLKIVIKIRFKALPTLLAGAEDSPWRSRTPHTNSNAHTVNPQYQCEDEHRVQCCY